MYSKRTTSYFIKTRLFENDINNDFDASLNENENEKNELNDHSKQNSFVKNLDVSNSEIENENVVETKSKRKIKIDAKMIVFDKRNFIEISNYQKFDFENNMKYDYTILSIEST